MIVRAPGQTNGGGGARGRETAGKGARGRGANPGKAAKKAGKLPLPRYKEMGKKIKEM